MTMDNGQWTFKKEDLLERILNFGVRIIKLVNKLPKTPAGFKVGSQLVGSATSIGANTQEAQDASSKPDFINKMSIALREAKESKFWLKLIKKAELLPEEEIDIELEEADQLCAIYSSIVKKAKLNLSNVKSQMSNALGFSIIELLVAASIIAIISTIGLTVFRGAFDKAKDSTRKKDLQTLSVALEAYLQANGGYIKTDDPNCNTAGTAKFYTDIKKYISGAVPEDPSGGKYCYYSENNGQSYRLLAKLDDCNDSSITQGIDCKVSPYNYQVASSDITTVAAAPGGIIGAPPISPPTPSPTPTGGGGTPPSTITSYFVFVTSQMYSGNLVGTANGLPGATVSNGLLAADKICKNLADNSSLSNIRGRNWMAWLSDDHNSPASRFYKSSVPYKLVDGTLIANDWTDLITAKTQYSPHSPRPYLRNGIFKNESGGAGPEACGTAGCVTYPLTNTNSDGTINSTTQHCSNWTSDASSSYALRGNDDMVSSSWTNYVSEISCGGTTTNGFTGISAPLYCFEQ